MEGPLPEGFIQVNSIKDEQFYHCCFLLSQLEICAKYQRFRFSFLLSLIMCTYIKSMQKIASLYIYILVHIYIVTNASIDMPCFYFCLDDLTQASDYILRNAQDNTRQTSSNKETAGSFSKHIRTVTYRNEHSSHSFSPDCKLRTHSLSHSPSPLKVIMT